MDQTALFSSYFSGWTNNSLLRIEGRRSFMSFNLPAVVVKRQLLFALPKSRTCKSSAGPFFPLMIPPPLCLVFEIYLLARSPRSRVELLFPANALLTLGRRPLSRMSQLNTRTLLPPSSPPPSNNFLSPFSRFHLGRADDKEYRSSVV